MTESTEVDLDKLWAKLRENPPKISINDGHVQNLKILNEEEMKKTNELWKQARTQMLALEERKEKRLKVEEQKLKEREQSLLQLRKDMEDAAMAKRNSQSLQLGKEDLQRLEEERRAEARRREREQRETLAPTVQFEEVWEVFN